MIECTFTLSEKEYVIAQEMFVQKKQPVLFWQSTISVFLIIASFTFLVFNFSAGNSGPFWLRGAAAGLLVGGVIGLPSGWLRRRDFRKRYKRDLRLFSNQRLQIDAYGLSGEVPGIGDGRIAWTAFEEWLKNSEVIVLVQSSKQISILPLGRLQPTEQTELLELLATHVRHPQALVGGT